MFHTCIDALYFVEEIDILGNTLIFFLAESQMRRLIPLNTAICGVCTLNIKLSAT